MIDGIPNHGWNMFFFQPRGIPDHFWLRDWSWHASGVGPKKMWLFSFDIRQPFQEFVFQTNKNRQLLNIILIYYMLYDMCNYTYTYAFWYVYIYIYWLSMYKWYVLPIISPLQSFTGQMIPAFCCRCPHDLMYPHHPLRATYWDFECCVYVYPCTIYLYR